MSDNYEIKKQARIDRMRERANKARSEAKGRTDQARKMASVIPFGQPILVGHHSEQRDRNYRKRIESNFRKGYEGRQEADELDRRADAAESNKSISSDDPEAVVKLQAKIDAAEESQARMKAANKFIRADDTEGLRKLGLSEATITKLLTPNYMGKVGFEPWQLSNNNANIRRMKKRIEILRAQSERTTKEVVYGSITLVENTEDNRLQLFYPGKPPDPIRADLKYNGFKWAPSIGCWQRQLNNTSIHRGHTLAAKHNEIMQE